MDLLLPSICPSCRCAGGPGLCDPCLAALPSIIHPCWWCGSSRRDAEARCEACGGQGFPHVHRLVVRFRYEGTLRSLVGDAKAGAKPAAVAALADLMPALPADVLAEIPMAVLPVPPSPGRRHGPHLATALARTLARRHGLPLLTRRLRTTRPAGEQHTLRAQERDRNVAGLFECLGSMPMHVVLVDDLITSGATASVACAAIKRAGAKLVTVVCLARTPLDRAAR